MKKHMTGGPGYLKSDLLFSFQTSEWSLLVFVTVSYFLLHSLQMALEVRQKQAKWRPSLQTTWFCDYPFPS